MQRETSILQHLTFRPQVSISDPATPDGKLWNSALKIITRSQGWSQLHWGTQIDSEEIVDLLITWNSHADLQHFMAHSYRPFLTAVKFLFASRDSDPPSVPSPDILQLHPGMPTLELGAVSSLYKLSFIPSADADLKTGLAIETQLCRNFLFDAAQGIGNGDLFLGMDAVWLSRYDSPPPSSSLPSSAPHSATDPKRNELPAPEETLLVIIEWANQNAEKTILERGKIEESLPGGQLFTIGEYFTRNLLQKARAYTSHRVRFENVSGSNVEWLDKEEGWSTYVKRLMMEEEERRGGKGAEEGG